MSCTLQIAQSTGKDVTKIMDKIDKTYIPSHIKIIALKNGGMQFELCLIKIHTSVNRYITHFTKHGQS